MEAMAELIAAARAVRENAYAPYSHYAVGAAVRAEDGSIYAGCNVENAASPEGLCAEAAAIAAMVAAGRRRLTAVAVVGGDVARPAMPCGGCRQRLHEFAAPGAVVAVADAAGRLLCETPLAALLPEAFGPGGRI
ncbi:cytidine deaminase [Oleispirillum naphthae]|uniref:cytidine deaminase n=1 Tax=Oleispirillum naphthae TaxID=2838853 RepID=UPI0030824D34